MGRQKQKQMGGEGRGGWQKAKKGESKARLSMPDQDKKSPAVLQPYKKLQGGNKNPKARIKRRLVCIDSAGKGEAISGLIGWKPERRDEGGKKGRNKKKKSGHIGRIIRAGSFLESLMLRAGCLLVAHFLRLMETRG